MLTPPRSAPLNAPEVAETPDQRRQRLREQLLAAARPLLDQMVDTLVAAPDRELFRSVEVQLRDLGQQLAAAAQQAGLDDRKKGATAAPVPPAPTAATTPASSATAPTTSSPSRAR